MHSPKRFRLTLIAAALSTVAVAPLAQASGFRIPEASVAGLGATNALVADAKDPGALAYNPAAMSFHSGMQIVSGIITIDPNISVITATGEHESQVDSPFYVPALFVMSTINSQWSWGLNINSPFGLETNWRDETFPAFGPLPSPPFPPGTNIDPLEPSRSKITMVNVNPNIAFKANANTSVAFGLDYYYVKEARLDTQAVKMKGDGGDIGWNVALMSVNGPWSFGLSYRSPVEVDIDGTLSAGPASGAAKTSVTFPALLQVGVRNQVNTNLSLEFDVELMRWSSFDVLTITHSAPGVPSPNVSTNDWSDSLAFRFGGGYRLNPDSLLRFGYSFDQTPQDSANFNARVPDSDRHLLGIGLAQNIAGWTFDAGYTYLVAKKRTIASSVPFGAFGSDANGTSAYNGKYQFNAHLFGLGVSKKF